jgi:hypothetical protein
MQGAGQGPADEASGEGGMEAQQNQPDFLPACTPVDRRRDVSGELRLSDTAYPEGGSFFIPRALNLPEAASVAPKMGREPRRQHCAFTHRCFVDALAGSLLWLWRL